MAAKHTRLELTWIGKDERPRLEPRILLEDTELSYHAATKHDNRDLYDNLLIQGDNLLALKALEGLYSSRVQCVSIDPPYNTGSAFTHYDDGIEHSLWLSLMRERARALHTLLAPTGSLWVFADDSEAHYLKILLDEVFGRSNFVANIIWQKTTSARNDALYFSASHDHLLVYAKNKESLLINGLPRTTASETAYTNPDNDPRGPWREGDYKCAKSADERPNLYYPIVHPFTGQEVWPRRNRVWAYSSDVCRQHMEDNLLWWGRTGNYTFPKLKRFRANAPETLVPTTLWLAEDVDQTRKARLESIALFPDDPFPTPKPERLISRIVQIASNPGDIVLDSFLGSGTTCAVAHKLGRRWIGIELQQHAITHCVPRMKKVIDGEDVGGITSVANWTGGGGYRFYRLATSLLDKDKWDNWVVSKEYQPEMLAEAMCKLEGFRYAPDPEVFWIHGQSTETDLIYVTTQNLSHEQLQFISDQVGDERTLLICCSAFRAKPDAFPNLTLKKIPQAVLHRCEWGRDDYSLNVNALSGSEPDANQEEEESSEATLVADTTTDAVTPPPARRRGRPRRQRSTMQELPLFANLDQVGDA